jgi:hypothetical protein
MPEKYQIHVVPTPGRFRRVGKYGSIDRREDCSRCTNCVKPRCVFDTYQKEAASNRDPDSDLETLYDCRACLSCVQGCTKGLLGIMVNPEYLALGDGYWKPDVMATTWKQADTGRIPVSGAGYRGPFHGPGFDSIWTDMSEIVRPTRDGIHGREYISTSVDIGPKPMRLAFSPDGQLIGEPARLIEIPLPLVLDIPAWRIAEDSLARARLEAAKTLGVLGVARAEWVRQAPSELLAHAVPLFDASNRSWLDELLDRVRMVEIADGAEALATARNVIARANPPIVALRLPLRTLAAERIAEATRAGIKVFHLCADLHGCELGVSHPRHVRDVLREIHGLLVKRGVRDEITLIVGGGIALAEHTAKAIICGADLVAVDTALLVALGCRVCRGSSAIHDETECPAELGRADPTYATQRMVNLMGAWHSQLIEVLGAMGIREVRRLRGEVGRAIFREDIEQEAFSDLVRRPH